MLLVVSCCCSKIKLCNSGSIKRNDHRIAIMGRWTGLSSLIDFHFEHGHHHHSSYRSGMRLSTRYHKLDDSIFVFCRNCGNSMKSEESKMAGHTGSTPTGRLRSNPKHFLTWSATMANNRIQKLGKNFVNNVSKLQNKMERVMPTFHPPASSGTSSVENCSGGSEQVENDLSEPINKDHHQQQQAQQDYDYDTSYRLSRVHKIPLSSSLNNCEKNGCKTGSCLSEGLSYSSGDANEERYSGFTVPSPSYHAQGKEILSGDAPTLAGSAYSSSGGALLRNVSSNSGDLCGAVTAITGPGFPHQVQVQSARIVQSHPLVPLKQDAGTTTPKSLVQSGHYKIPPNPTITAEALKAMIINSPTELNSCRKFDEKPQPIKCVEVDATDIKNMLELRTIQHENQSKYNLSCGSSGTSTSNNASLSDSSTSPPMRINAPQWSRTSSLSTFSSSTPHNNPTTVMPTTSILKNSLSTVQNEYDKRNNNSGTAFSNLNGNIEEIRSRGIDNEGLAVTDAKPATVSFSSPIIESSDKASLLMNAKKTFTRRIKSSKNSNVQGNMKNSNNNNNNNNHSDNNKKRSVAFQNPLSGSTSVSNRKHASFSPEAYPPSQLTVTILEEEAELRHAPWFQAGIPRDIALEVLRNEPIGSFIVRESTTKAGCFALSLRVPKEFKRLGIAHYLILKGGRGYKIKGFTKEFKSLNSLITHHSVMPELLPCPLSLHRYRPNHPQKISRFNSSDFMEPEKLFTYFVDCLESS